MFSSKINVMNIVLSISCAQLLTACKGICRFLSSITNLTQPTHVFGLKLACGTL